MSKNIFRLIIAMSFLLIANAILIDHVYAGVEPSPFKRIINQRDIDPIKYEITKARQKLLNKNTIGEISLTPNIKDLKNLMKSLSGKVDNAKSDYGKNKDLTKLSNGISEGTDIINGLNQKVTAKNKSDSLKQLKSLSDVLLEMEDVIQSFQNIQARPLLKKEAGLLQHQRNLNSQ